MALLSHLNPILSHLKTVCTVFTDRILHASNSQKVIVVTVTASVAVLGVLARYMRRKRLVVNPRKYRRFTGKRSRASGVRSPNGDAPSHQIYSVAASVVSGGGRSSFAGSRMSRGGPPSVVTVSERGSVASGSHAGTGSITLGGGEPAKLTPQQLGVMGMEALETSVEYWEDAMSAYRSEIGAVLSPDEAAFCKDLQALLDAAFELQEKGELLFLDQRSVLFGRDTTSPESFASAVDRVADLKDFEDEDEGEDSAGRHAMYTAALARLEDGAGVPCRFLRTELVRCGSDTEYLAKLHCIRLAYQKLLSDQSIWHWIADAGRQTLANMLIYADRDPKDFLVAYEAMLAYVHDSENRPQIEQELAARGVKALTFYDVVIDYILMDAFEDLDQPPSSVTAVVQNRWLSDGFKETALATAVWSVLKAKKRMLKHPDGFMAHFYAISEQLLPLLAWGFLGPDDALRETCVYFKDQVIGLIADMFNFKKCRYSNVDDLASDMMNIMRIRLANVEQRLCA